MFICLICVLISWNGNRFYNRCRWYGVKQRKVFYVTRFRLITISFCLRNDHIFIGLFKSSSSWDLTSNFIYIFYRFSISNRCSTTHIFLHLFRKTFDLRNTTCKTLRTHLNVVTGYLWLFVTIYDRAFVLKICVLSGEDHTLTTFFFAISNHHRT